MWLSAVAVGGGSGGGGGGDCGGAAAVAAAVGHANGVYSHFGSIFPQAQHNAPFLSQG